jgi:hypothetical protein
MLDSILQALGGFFAVSIVFGGLFALTMAAVHLFRNAKPPQIVGAQLPVLDESIDLSKRYDIVYGAGHETTHEKLSGVRILGYLRSDRDQTTGEYTDSRWLVAELPDGRRAYLRPRSVLWLLESGTNSSATDRPDPRQPNQELAIH